jgi:hypothetical protein
MGAAVALGRGFLMHLDGPEADRAATLGVGQRVRIWLGDGYQSLEARPDGTFRIAELVEVRDAHRGGELVGLDVWIERVRGGP